MATTEHFSAKLQAVTEGEIDDSKPSIKVELLVSSYSGEYAAYFKVIEDDGSERVFSISTEQLGELRAGSHDAHQGLAG